jgi:hypothetical protein
LLNNGIPAGILSWPFIAANEPVLEGFAAEHLEILLKLAEGDKNDFLSRIAQIITNTHAEHPKKAISVIDHLARALYQEACDQVHLLAYQLSCLEVCCSAWLQQQECLY